MSLAISHVMSHVYPPHPCPNPGPNPSWELLQKPRPASASTVPIQSLSMGSRSVRVRAESGPKDYPPQPPGAEAVWGKARSASLDARSFSLHVCHELLA